MDGLCGRNQPLAEAPMLIGAPHSFPEEWADKSWDNVGLLLGNLQSRIREEKPVVLLTNDLTPQVGVEATTKGASVIVSYRQFADSSHPLSLA